MLSPGEPVSFLSLKVSKVSLGTGKRLNCCGYSESFGTRFPILGARFPKVGAPFRKLGARFLAGSTYPQGQC